MIEKFKFKGKTNKAMNVVLEEELVFLSKPEQSVEEKNDTEYYENNYNKVDFTMKLAVYNKNLDDIFEWLNGKGELEYKGRVTTAFFYQKFNPERMASLNSISIPGIRLPFWYKANDDFIEVNDNKIINEGNIEVKPILKIEKGTTDLVDISVNDVRFSYQFPENEDYVLFDCDNFNATYDGLYRNENMVIDFEYPTLYPGENTIIINEGDCNILVKRKDCWL